MITLYHRPDCPFCWRVRLAMAALGVPYQEVVLQLGEKPAELLALNPKGTVPVMVDGDLVISESAVILDYLAALHGGLLPESPAEQARLRQRVLRWDPAAGAALRDIIFEKRAKPEPAWDQARIRQGEANWQQCLAELEQQLPQHSQTLTVADCVFGSRFGCAEAYGAAVDEHYPRLYAWYQWLKQQPAWQQAYPSAFIRTD